MKQVTYTGFGRRVISKKDWKSIGIEAENMEWPNRGASVTAELTDEQVEYFTKTDNNFKVSDADDDAEPRTTGVKDKETPDTAGGDAAGTKASGSTDLGSPSPSPSRGARSTR